MGFPPLQSMEFSDFSGGITENYLQGDPRRFQSGDNYFITVDKKLRGRFAFIPMDNVNYVLPNSLGQRIDGMYMWISESTLFAQTGRKFFTQSASNTWNEVTGLNNVDVMSGGDARSQTTYAEFQRLIFVTGDGSPQGVGLQPSKIYQNTSNSWVSKTAGLPRAYTTPNFQNSTLLAACILNANAIRASMVSHFQDAVNSTYVSGGLGQQYFSNLHYNIDRYSLSLFQSVVFTTEPDVPAVPPTPQGAATDQTSLFLLVQALNNAYTFHVADSSIGAVGGPVVRVALDGTSSTGSTYHLGIALNMGGLADPSVVPPKGPFALLSNSGAPSTLVQAAAMLDDLLQKWNWHRKAVWTHSPNNDPFQFDKYIPACSAIGTIYLSSPFPAITPDFTDIVNFANNLKSIYNYHMAPPPGSFSINFAHSSGPTNIYNYYIYCNLPDATDLTSAYLLIYWIRAIYYAHYLDAAVTNRFTINFAGTASSTSLSSITGYFAGTSAQVTVGQYLALTDQVYTFADRSGTSSGLLSGNTLIARVTVSGSGTATVDAKFSNSQPWIGQVSTSKYHYGFSGGTIVDSVNTSLEQTTDAIATPLNSTGSDSLTWLTLGQEVFFALTNHMNNLNVHNSKLVTGQAQKAIAACVNPFYIPSVSTVSYSFHFTDSYTVGQNGVQYLVQSNPVLSQSTNIAISYPVGYTIVSPFLTVYPSITNTVTRANVLTNLPVLVNQQNTNYDTGNVKLNIYRTINGGSTYYLIGQVANGTTSFTDTVNDTLSTSGNTALINNQQLYTTGGIVGSDQPPIAKFIHILNGTTYYAGITQSGQYFGQRILQAIQFAPDWAPSSFTDDLDDQITGVSSTKSNVIAFCVNSIYRMSGGFNQTGQGALTHDKISDSLGAVNAKSIVKTEIGVFFAGNDGFYYTDGYQVIKLSLELNSTYAALTASAAQRRAIYGAYDKITRKVWWSCQASPNDMDNSVVYVFYLDFGIKPSGVFTLVNGANFVPSSLVFSQGTLFYGHGSGYILKSTYLQTADALISTSVVASAWNTAPIPYNYISTAIDMGTIYKRKYLTKWHYVGGNSGDSLMQMGILKDLNTSGIGTQNCFVVDYKDNAWWGNPACVWGDVTQKWKYDGKLDVWRRIPRMAIRSDFVQLSVQPANAIIYYCLPASSTTQTGRSYPLGTTVAVDSTAKTATIATPSGYTSITFMPEIVNYYISFGTNAFALKYLITALDATNKIVTFSDAANTSTNDSAALWQISGIKKTMRPTITAMALTYATVGGTNPTVGEGDSQGGVNI